MPQTNILKMLQDEHRMVTRLFKDLEKTTPQNLNQRQDIFSEIDETLSMHADFEERAVYPLLAGRKTSKSIALEAVEEHIQLKRLLGEIRELDPQDERWMAKVQVLLEDVRHHMKEEEGEAFPEVRKEVGAETLQRLAQDYQAFKEEAQQEPAAVSSKTKWQTPVPVSSSSNTAPQQAKQRQPRTKAKKEKATEKAKDNVDSLQNAEE